MAGSDDKFKCIFRKQSVDTFRHHRGVIDDIADHACPDPSVFQIFQKIFDTLCGRSRRGGIPEYGIDFRIAQGDLDSQ